MNDIEALGKHLFYRWDNGEILHVHLGLFGKFKTFGEDAPGPTRTTRLAMAGSRAAVYLTGPTICELIDPEREDALRARLGPDPLADPDAGEQFAANIARRRIPIGAALLDQGVVAGVGNVYRAEVLYKCGIDPHTPADRIGGRRAGALWSAIAQELRRGERSGRIVTVAPSDLGVRRRSDVPAAERFYVYKREGRPCRRCGAEIRFTRMASRTMWWCPACQAS